MLFPKKMQMENKIDYREVLKKQGNIIKFANVAPEGFILVHEKTLTDLQDFEIWKDWKNGIISIQSMNNKNFEDS